MTFLSSVIRQPSMADAPVVLGNRAPYRSPEMEAELELAREEGFRAGRQAADADLSQTVRAVTDALVLSVESGADALRVAAEHGFEELIGLARDIAEVVYGTVEDGRAEVAAERILDAVSELDDTGIVVRVADVDAETVRSLLQKRPDLTVQPDPSLRSGEARISGRWASVDLTFDAIWDRLRSHLE